MKIKDMDIEELIDAIDYMNNVPNIDPHFSGWNFDEASWKDKLEELMEELEIKNKTNLDESF